MIRRLAVLVSLGLVAQASGCMAPARRSRPTLGGATRAGPKKVTKAAPSRETPWRYWRDELGRYSTIPQLWNAINRHHDALGYALQPRYPTTRITLPRRRVHRRPGAGDPPPDRPSPPRIDRPPVDAHARAPLCRRACNHVRAICYAARRICQIARHLREYRALVTCKRATARCADARRAARRRCRSCG